MRRGTTRTMGDRAAMGMSRAVIDKINDTPFMQTLGLKIRGAEGSTDVEHFHPFGSTAFPMGKTTDEQAKGGMMKGAPEVLLNTLMGNQSHPIAMPAADRRFRPNGMKEGEHVLHDAFKQFLHFGKEMAALESPKQLTFRVAKDKEQQQGQSGGGGSGGSAGGGQSGAQQKKNNGANVAAEKDEQVNITAKKDGTLDIAAQGAGTITAKSLTIKAGGCSLTMADGKITLKGEVHLGDDGGKRIGIIGTKDDKGDALVQDGTATKVYAI